MKIGQRLSELRRGRGLSQEALADALGVSRQAVGKWESGQALPELGKLVEFCDFFAVTLDALVRDEPCAKGNALKADHSRAALVPFLIRAKRACYAGHGGEQTPARPASHDLAYAEGDLFYLDTYLGGEKFAGEEALWVRDRPIWSMNYAGRTLGPGFSGDFLKEALAAVTEEAPFRGPALYARGASSYHCLVNGDFDWFEGYEEIFTEGVKVFECRFHGGAIL
jgi:transcriptional regulator with XRE-family HTH domain